MIDIPCALSAFCFFLSNVLGLVVIVHYRNREYRDFDSYRNLDPKYLQMEWDHRHSNAGLVNACGTFNALAWFLLASPIIQLSWILSRGGKRQVAIHAAMACLAMGGAVIEMLSKLMVVGGWSAARWISRDLNLESWTVDGGDGIGWRALEVTYLITEGLLLWVDAFEWLSLFGILVLTYYSVGTTPENKHTFGRFWPFLGLVIAFLCFIDFAADVLRLEEWRVFTRFAMFVSVVNTVFLLPAWVLMLGRVLPKSMPNYVESGQDDFYATTNIAPAGLQSHPSPAGPPPSLFLNAVSSTTEAN